MRSLSAFIRFFLLDPPSPKDIRFRAFHVYLLAPFVIEHDVTPDHWIGVSDSVEDFSYFFIIVILSF